MVGEALVWVFFQDLIQKNTELPLPSMRKDQKAPGPLKGALTMENLAQDLATRDSFPAPFVFARARQLVRGAGKDVADCLVLGFQALDLRWFPSIKYRDLRKHKVLTWNFVDYVELYSKEGKPSVHALAGAMSGDICTEIERRSLSYARNLERSREHGMPWLPHCLVMLPKTLVQQKQLWVLLSCIGIIQNGDYVSYRHLGTLLKEMGMTQAELQKLQLQSKFLLPKVYISLWRLHDTIPYRMGPPPKPLSNKIFHEKEVEDAEREEEDVQAADEEEVKPDTSRGLYVAANARKNWTPQELSFIHLNPDISRTDSYQRYLEACWDHFIPAHSRKAFYIKYHSLKAKH